MFRAGRHSFFVHGFAKNAKANVSTKELKALRQLADVLLGFSTEQVETAVAGGELIEVLNDGNEG